VSANQQPGPQSGKVLPGMRLALLMLLLCAPGAVPVTFADTPGEVQVGETLPEATMQGLNGPPRKLSEYRGTPLIINVWASWCSPCRAEMASLERLSWMELATRFNVIGISTDDYPEKAKDALQTSNATITHFIDAKLQLENMLGASRLPLTVLVDADGRVLKKIYGAREWDAPQAVQWITETFGANALQSGD
jgi:peroxiredoxin